VSYLFAFHSVHGVVKARILKLFAIPFSRRWPWNSQRTGHLPAGNGEKERYTHLNAELKQMNSKEK